MRVLTSTHIPLSLPLYFYLHPYIFESIIIIIMEKNDIARVSSSEHREVVDRTMTNDEIDHVAESAVGGDLADMPKGYYTNWRFIGSVAAVSFMAQGLYLGTLLALPNVYVSNSHNMQATCFQPIPSALSMQMLVRTPTMS